MAPSQDAIVTTRMTLHFWVVSRGFQVLNLHLPRASILTEKKKQPSRFHRLSSETSQLVLPRFLNHYLKDHSQDGRFSSQCHGDPFRPLRIGFWDPFHSWPNFKWRFSTGKRPDPNHLRLHPGMMILQVYPQHHSTWALPNNNLPPLSASRLAVALTKASSHRRTDQANFLAQHRWSLGQRHPSPLGRNNPSEGAAVWPMRFVEKKKRHFLEKEKHTKWFETGNKTILSFWMQITETIILCVYVYLYYIFGVVVYGMRSMCLRNPSIRNYNVVY